MGKGEALPVVEVASACDSDIGAGADGDDDDDDDDDDDEGDNGGGVEDARVVLEYMLSGTMKIEMFVELMEMMGIC